MKKSKIQQLQEAYTAQANARKDKIRQDPSKFRRFWRWVLYLICFPWIWLFYNIRDWRSAVCIVISLLLWSSSVWIFYLLYYITRNNWFMITGTAVWMWWLSPVGSPFIILVTATAIGLKALVNKFTHYEKK